jgi:hypothetical protein
MSTFFESLVRESFVRAAPLSWIAAAGMGVALASCLVAVLLRARLARPLRWRAFPIFLCALALLTATAAAFAGVEIGRRDLAGQLETREALVEAASDAISRGIPRQLTGLALLGPIALVSLVSAGLLRWVLRQRPAVPPSRATVALGMTVVLPLIVGALGASTYGFWMHAGYIGLADVSPFNQDRVMLQRLQQGAHLLTLLRASITVSAGAGLIAATVWARSAGARPLGRAGVAMASAIFAAGLGAFAATRVQAADRPLPILTYNQRDDSVYFGIVHSQEMPRFSRCSPLSAAAPVLEFSANDVLFDRAQVSPEDVRDKLGTYRDSFPLLHPGKPLPPPALLVLADVTTPIDRMFPYLFYAGEIEIVMVGSNPLPFTSRTLGIIERREFCYRAFLLGEDGVPVSSYRTWRDLALAVDRSATSLRIAAR